MSGHSETHLVSVPGPNPQFFQCPPLPRILTCNNEMPWGQGRLNLVTTARRSCTGVIQLIIIIYTISWAAFILAGLDLAGFGLVSTGGNGLE